MKKKKVPIIGAIVLIVIAAFAGGIFYWNTHKKRIIRTEIDKAIEKKSDGLYKVNYDSLELDEINGHLSLSSFTLSYDSLKFEQLKSEHKEPYLLFRITAPALHIRGIQTPRAFIDKEIRGRHLTLVNPHIEIVYTGSGKDSWRSIPDKEIYEQIPGNLNLIQLYSVVITGAEVVTKNLESGKSFVRFTNLSISLRCNGNYQRQTIGVVYSASPVIFFGAVNIIPCNHNSTERKIRV